jgi:hypothetical protein
MVSFSGSRRRTHAGTMNYKIHDVGAATHIDVFVEIEMVATAK